MPKENSASYIGSLFGMFRRKESNADENQENCEGFVMSLCGDFMDEIEKDNRIFEENIVKFDDFQKDPWKIINDCRLVLKINGKIYN